jgi:hypothetical protein
VTSLKTVAFSLALALLPALAVGQTPPANVTDKIAAEIQNQAVFCDGVCALCIKAPCVPTVTIDRLGNYTVDHAACSCQVVKGWSMGPGQCADRGPVRQGNRTFMISTYSNRFNAMNGTLNNTLSCSDTSTVWAWCYGAPCVVDSRDPTKATCNCPLQTGPMQTLGGSCDANNCKYIYSAATPAGDLVANLNFAHYMQQHNYPHTLPAKACMPTTAK